MAGKNPFLKKMEQKPIGGGASSSWSPWQLVGQVFGNGQHKTPKFENPKDYGTTKLEMKNEKIKEAEKALEEEKRKIANNERDKAKLKEDKEKHGIADQRLKDLQLQLQNAKNQNKNNNANASANNNNNKHRIIERPKWIGRKN